MLQAIVDLVTPLTIDQFIYVMNRKGKRPNLGCGTRNDS